MKLKGKHALSQLERVKAECINHGFLFDATTLEGEYTLNGEIISIETVHPGLIKILKSEGLTE